MLSCLRGETSSALIRPVHLPVALVARPRVVWMQLGIGHDEVAEALARAGIKVVQDR